MTPADNPQLSSPPGKATPFPKVTHIQWLIDKGVLKPSPFTPPWNSSNSQSFYLSNFQSWLRLPWKLHCSSTFSSAHSCVLNSLPRGGPQGISLINLPHAKLHFRVLLGNPAWDSDLRNVNILSESCQESVQSHGARFNANPLCSFFAAACYRSYQLLGTKHSKEPNVSEAWEPVTNMCSHTEVAAHQSRLESSAGIL